MGLGLPAISGGRALTVFMRHDGEEDRMRRDVLGICWLVLGVLIFLAVPHSGLAKDHPASAFGVGLGFLAGGSGTVEAESGGESAELEFDDESDVTFLAWYLGRVGPASRMGFQFAYTSSVEFEATGYSVSDGDGDYDSGSGNGKKAKYGQLVTFDGLFCQSLTRDSTVDVFLQLVGGLAFLFPDDDYERMLKKADFSEDPKLGFNFGGGAGVAFDVTDGITLRGDLLAQYVWLKLLDEDNVGGGDYGEYEGSSSLEETSSSTRYMLTIGVEWGS